MFQLFSGRRATDYSKLVDKTMAQAWGRVETYLEYTGHGKPLEYDEIVDYVGGPADSGLLIQISARIPNEDWYTFEVLYTRHFGEPDDYRYLAIDDTPPGFAATFNHHELLLALSEMINTRASFSKGQLTLMFV